MRIRSVTIGLTVLFLVAATLLVRQGHILLKANESVKMLLLEALRPWAGDQVIITSTDIGFDMLSIRDVEFASADGAFRLQIDEIQVGYSLTNLIANRFRPYRAAESVTVIRPRLYLNAARRPHSNTVSLYDVIDAYAAVNDDMDFVRRIVLKDGAVFWQEAGGQSTQIVDAVSGWVDKQGDHNQVRLGVDGRFLETDRQNIKIIGSLDFEQDAYHLDVDIQEFDVSQRVPFYHPSDFQFTSGRLDGSVHITADRTLRAQQTVNLDGRIALTDVGVVLTGTSMPVDSIFMTGTLVRNDLEFSELYQMFHGTRVNYSGRIHDIFDPELDLHLTAGNLDLQTLQQAYFNNLQMPLDGRLQVDARVEGPVARPRLTGQVRVPHLQLATQEWNEVSGSLALDTAGVSVKDFCFEAGKTRYRVAVDYAFRPENTIKILLEADHQLDWLSGMLPGVRETGKRAGLRLGLSGTKGRLSGPFTLDVTGGEQAIAITGAVSWQDTLVHFQGEDQTRRFKFSGSTTTVGRSVRLDTLANPFVLLTAVTDTPFWAQLNRSWDTRFQGALQDSQLQWTGAGQRIGRFDAAAPPQFTISGTRRAQNQGCVIRSTVFYTPTSGEPFSLDVQAEQAGNHWRFGRIEAPGLFSAEGSYVDGEEPTLDGRIDLNTQVTELARLLDMPFWELRSGEIAGNIQVSGPLKHPQSALTATLRNAVIGQVAGYEGALAVSSSDGSRYEIGNLELRYEDHPVVWGWGECEPLRDKMFMQMEVHDVSAGLLFATLNKESRALEGQIDLHMDLRGSLSRPFLNGSAKIENGTLAMIPFDRLTLAFGDTPAAPDTASDPAGKRASGLFIHELDIRQNDNLRFSGAGYLPFNNREALDFSLHGQGDMLHLLDNMDTFFKGTTGTGDVRMHFSGSLDQPVVESGRLRIENGTLRMRSAARRVTQVNMDIELAAGERFIRFHDLSGRIAGETVAIRNTPQADITLPDGRRESLTPMVFMEDGLTWGILILDSGKNGVTFNIPKMMEPDELVTLFLDGREAGEDCYLAGPLMEPRLRGTIRVKDMEFTYPFLFGPNEQPSLAQKLLSQMRMDLLVLSLDNNRYQTSIASGISTFSDDVEVDLILNRDLDNGINVTGVLDDGTFAMDGIVRSNRGSIEYMDLLFRPEEIRASFIGSQTAMGPVLSGRAWTTVRDSIPYDVYLEIYSRDPESGRIINAGVWENVEFQLSSNLPSREIPIIQEQSKREILSALGYGTDNLGTRGSEMVGARADRMLVRPLFRPIERGVRGLLGLDEFRVRPALTRGVAREFAATAFGGHSSAGFTSVSSFSTWDILQSSSVVLGKHFLSDFYFSYSGRVVPGYGADGVREGLAFNNLVGLEYRIAPGLLMELQYDYQRDRTLFGREDARIWFRHYFDLW